MTGNLSFRRRPESREIAEGVAMMLVITMPGKRVYCRLFDYGVRLWEAVHARI